MHLAFPRAAGSWLALGIPAAFLAFAAFILLASPHPLPWLSAGLALIVGGAAILATAWRRFPGASVPTTAILGS